MTNSTKRLVVSWLSGFAAGHDWVTGESNVDPPWKTFAEGRAIDAGVTAAVQILAASGDERAARLLARWGDDAIDADLWPDVSAVDARMRAELGIVATATRRAA